MLLFHTPLLDLPISEVQLATPHGYDELELDVEVDAPEPAAVSSAIVTHQYAALDRISTRSKRAASAMAGDRASQAKHDEPTLYRWGADKATVYLCKRRKDRNRKERYETGSKNLFASA